MSSIKHAAQNALAILREQLETSERAEVVEESDAEALAERITTDLLGHEAAE